MTFPVRLALAFLPLAAYFFLLGSWQAGRRPRVVSGPADFALLAFGLGGLIAFGPLGGLIVRAAFPRPNAWAWLSVASGFGLIALVGAARARSRVVVYHVDPSAIHEAIERSLTTMLGPTRRTVRGFDDAEGRRGVTVDLGRGMRNAVVEAHGDGPQALAESLRSSLAALLSKKVVVPSRAASLTCFALSTLALAPPLTVALLARPEFRAAIRWIRGGP